MLAGIEAKDSGEPGELEKSVLFQLQALFASLQVGTVTHDYGLLHAVVGLSSSYQTPACTSMHAWLFPTSSVMLIPTRFPLLVVVQTSEKKSSDTLSFCKTLTDYSGEPIRLQVHTHTDTWRDI